MKQTNKILLTLLFLLAFASTTTAHSAPIKIKPDHIFTITFTHAVKLNKAANHIKLTCEWHIDYTLQHGEQQNTLHLIPNEKLQNNMLYTIEINAQLQNTQGTASTPLRNGSFSQKSSVSRRPGKLFTTSHLARRHLI